MTSFRATIAIVNDYLRPGRAETRKRMLPTMGSIQIRCRAYSALFGDWLPRPSWPRSSLGSLHVLGLDDPGAAEPGRRQQLPVDHLKHGPWRHAEKRGCLRGSHDLLPRGLSHSALRFRLRFSATASLASNLPPNWYTASHGTQYPRRRPLSRIVTPIGSRSTTNARPR